MATILHIDASARTSRSLSRQLSRDFIDAWQSVRPQDEIIIRDIGRAPPPAMTEGWIGAVFTKEEDRTAEQRQIIALSDPSIPIPGTRSTFGVSASVGEAVITASATMAVFRSFMGHILSQNCLRAG